MIAWRSIAALAVLSWVGGPASVRAEAPAGLAEPAPEPDAIIGGVPTEPGELDAVIAFRNSANRQCSGTLVTTRLIVTAAHCLVEHREGYPIQVYFGPDTSGPSVDALEFGTHPSFCSYCDEEAWDFGYIVLPEPYEPADGVLLPLTDQREWDETMREDRVVLLAGYGTDDPTANGVLREELKRQVTTTIRRFTENGFEMFAGGNQRDTCPGDSGGPAIVMLGSGERRLAGVTSRGSNPCGNGGFYGVPFVALPWLRDQTGIDLLPPGCPFADCLDLTPPAEDEGCAGCHAGEGTAGSPWLLLLLLRPRRRRRAPGSRPRR
ncbi:MAG: S1 family peptidase [Myxococcales bacterium]|nr:S1 family peptidase [Myxococcales bacterium]MCB9716370.1 S1 family peptidase [Myxococcales bacterium]